MKELCARQAKATKTGNACRSCCAERLLEYSVTVFATVLDSEDEVATYNRLYDRVPCPGPRSHVSMAGTPRGRRHVRANEGIARRTVLSLLDRHVLPHTTVGSK